ncbi:MAG: sigma-70 family RNA polymerase sigma factor [Verrucomicrobiota bacterium]
MALARSILRDAQLAEDIHQDMLIKVFEHVETFDGPRHLRDWSWKVLRNRCYEVIRQSKYRPVLLDPSILELTDEDLEHRDPEDEEQRSVALKSCLDGLTEHAKQIVRLRFFEGLRGKEVAERLGRKPDAVYKSLQRIYARLSECIRRKLDAERGVTT